MLICLSLNRIIASCYNPRLFSRPQLDALLNTYTTSFLSSTGILIPSLCTHIANIPGVSLSLLDSKLWLNEMASLAIPSIQLCDSQSNPTKICYPIVSNNKSAPFSYLLIYLFSEATHSSSLFEHSLFIKLPFLNKTKLSKTNKTFVFNNKIFSYRIQGFTLAFHKFSSKLVLSYLINKLIKVLNKIQKRCNFFYNLRHRMPYFIYKRHHHHTFFNYKQALNKLVIAFLKSDYSTVDSLRIIYKTTISEDTIHIPALIPFSTHIHMLKSLN
jgi:hypothetical protein